MLQTAKKLKGFSLGEVMLAGFVITVGVMASMALIVKSIEYTQSNRDAIVAAELAQEGIELVRNVRDNDLAAGNNGFTGFSGQRHCQMDVDDFSLGCNGSQGSPASRSYNLALIAGRFRHTAAPSRFKRYLYVDYNSGQRTAQVLSYVFWDWSDNNAMPSYVPNNSPGSGLNPCTLQNKCVFTEALLTQWHQ